jgi:penicillin-binding protein 2
MIEERRRAGIRLTILQYLITAVFSLLAVSFWVLQVVQHAQYREMAESNHQRTLVRRAPRGMVFDRNGEPLVLNRNSHSISIDREQTKDLDRTIRVLADVIGVDQARVREVVDRHRREPRYRPITIVADATLAQVAAVTARRYELPDVVVEEVPTRQYQPKALAAHLFGYVGEASEAQVKEDEAVKSGDVVGQSGLEKVYNKLLMGEDGAKRVVVNSVGREMSLLEEIDPSEGHRLKLTIDIDVQRAVEDGFRAFGFNGAAVIMDPVSGELLAFTSLPAYDPNIFAAGIDGATWTALNRDALRPLTNRAIQGIYSPGSTFKMVVAAAALEEGLITPDHSVYCGGSGVFYGRAFRCHKAGGHGTVTLRQAIEQSCNVYFYTIGNSVGIDRIHKWATLLGIGVKSGVDLPNEAAGIMPSTEWKRRRTGEKWYAGETISVSIGQGQVSVTPMSLAVMMATLANGGTRVTPHLLKAVDEGRGWKEVPPPAPQSRVTMKPENLQAIRDGLWMVVNHAGTGGRARIPGYDVAGKTGTAQVISIEGGRAAAGRTTRDLRDHGWFVFFAPRDNPTIAGVIFAEHAEHGYSAAPIAKYAMETFFAKREARALPPPLTAQPPLPAPPEERPVPEPAIAQGTQGAQGAQGARGGQ